MAEAKGLPEDSLQKLMEQSAFVQKAAVRHSIQMADVPNDPQYASQYAHTAIGMEPVWALNKGDPSVIVAVVDSGVDMTHEEVLTELTSNEEAMTDPCEDDG